MTRLRHILIMIFAVVMSMTISGGVIADLVDGKPSLDRNRDSGMFVWRTYAGTWQMRLLAGGVHQEFNGLVESEQPIDSLKRIGIERSDDVDLLDVNELMVSMHVKKNNIDGFWITIPDGSGLCLRGTGNQNAVVYLGKNATQASLPVDLTGSGACGNAVVDVVEDVALPDTQADAVTDQVNVASTRKYNPGHYIAMVPWDADDHPVMIDSIKPGVVGFHKRYHWRELEPSLGQYDFSQIQRDLDLLAGQGMQLIIQIEDKTFNSVKPTPSYLWAEYTLPNRAGGYSAVRYAPYVVTRMKALIRAMGQRFDAHPNFEGVAIQESAIGFDGATMDATGYTPEKYRDALISVLTDASVSFPSSRVFWYMNFLSRGQAYLGDVASAVAPLGVVMGGPDALPDDYSLNKHTYPFYEQFKGQMPMFCSAQFNSYKHLHQDTSYPTKYWTMGELFRFMRDDLHVNYMFWTRKPRSSPSDSYNWADALPVIERNPAFNY